MNDKALCNGCGCTDWGVRSLLIAACDKCPDPILSGIVGWMHGPRMLSDRFSGGSPLLSFLQRNRTGFKMFQQWEYRCIPCPPSYRLVFTEDEAGQCQKWFNDEGAAGWELCCFVFKRPVDWTNLNPL